MKSTHDFVAERPLAQHCRELLPAPLPERDLLGDVAAMIRDLCEHLTPGISGVANGKALRLRGGSPVRTETATYIGTSDPQTAHCVIDLPGCGSLLFSLPHCHAFSLTDRAYGGTGEVPDPLPEKLPFSADLTVKQLEQSWCDALLKLFPDHEPATIARRGSALDRLDPYCGNAECIHLELTVEQEGHEAWTLALSASVSNMMQAADRHRGSAGMKQRPARASNPEAAPFGDIPLPARAILAKMPMALDRAANLKPGDTIPLSIARDVPLSIAGETVAFGMVGAQDDCVALQITRAAIQ